MPIPLPPSTDLTAAPDQSTFKAKLTQVIESIRGVIGSDGTAATARNMLGLAGAVINYNNRGAWVTAVTYAVSDLATQGGVVYVCAAQHVASVFATDLAAGNWTVHQGLTREELALMTGATLVGRTTLTGENQTVDSSLKLSEAQPVSGSNTATAGGALAKLKMALTDDFYQTVNIRLIGDSITWGMIATGNGSQTPRGHALTDTRDVLTSKSWANKLRDYFGKNYASSALIAGVAGAGSYTKPVKMSCEEPRIYARTKSGNAAAKSQAINAGFIYGTAVDLIGTADLQGLEFDFNGSSLTIIHTQLVGFAPYELFVDGVSVAVVPTAGAATFSIATTHTFTPGLHKVRIENTSTTAALRIEGIRWTKTISVANDGLIGTSSQEWLPTGAILPASIQATDDFVIVGLGTNDRAEAIAPLAPSKTANNLEKICNYLTGLSKQVILVSPNAVTQSEAAYYYTQADVMAAVRRIAAKLRIDLIDNYIPTSLYKSAGISYLADGLHPQDTGHELIARNFQNAIEQAPMEQTPMGGTVGQLIKTQTLTVPVLAVATGKSYQNIAAQFLEMPTHIVGIELRAKSAAGVYGSYTYTQDSGDNSVTGGAFPTISGGAQADINVTAWVMRLYRQSGTNLRLGFVNTTGAAQNVVVELTVAYI